MRRICCVCSKLDPPFYESLEELTKELLEFLLIKVNFTIEDPLVCAECKGKILQSFDFKGKCVLTDDILYLYIKDSNGTKIDLRSIYFRIVKLEGNKILKNLKICRLCLIEVNNNFYELSEDVLAKYGIDRFFFRNFIPEVNLDAIESPCLCEVCMESLLRFAKFVTSTVEKPTEIAGETEKIPNTLKRSAKEDAIAKLQSYTDESKKVKRRQKPSPKKKPTKHKFRCEKCTYTTPLRRDIFRHFESHHAKTKCPHCLWTTDSKFALQMHIRKRHQANKCHTCDLFFTSASRLRCHLAETHKTSDRIFRCAQCSFACTQRSSLNRHAFRHADPVKRHVCDECGFSAVLGHNLAKHKLVHQKADRAPSAPPSGDVRRCRLCPFTTKDKKSYSEHLYVHKYFSVTSEGYFKCVKCDFVSARINRLRKHALVHLKMRRCNKASNRIFDCDRCDFVTIYVESWRRHIAVHSSQRVSFHCNECPYVSKYRGNLAKHLEKHRRTAGGKKAVETGCSAEDAKGDSKGYVRRCSVCSFRAKNKSTYTRHLRVYGH